jgi:hypothetical protein
MMELKNLQKQQDNFELHLNGLILLKSTIMALHSQLVSKEEKISQQPKNITREVSNLVTLNEFIMMVMLVKSIWWSFKICLKHETL